MVHMLSLTENLHTILRVLYDDMMVLCYPMSQVAMAIAGIGALLYIAYRVWQSLAQAEPIDLFPLMRPFAIGICILFFPTLVLGSLNGILSPLVKATHSLMAGQTLDRMNEERSSWSVKGLIFKGLAWILELLFAAASVILDVLRTFYLVVLSLLGPIAFAISVFDGFQSTLTQWLTKYVSIYLWLPISDLFSAIIARLQSLAMRHDTELMEQGYNWYVDWSSSLNLIFMLVAVCGYLCIPSIASWVVQANGFAAYNKTVSKMTSLVSAGAGWAAGKAWAGTKGVGKAAWSGTKAAGRGIAAGARLIFKK